MAACSAPAASPRASDGKADLQAQPAYKRIRVAIMGDPPTLSDPINSAGGAGVPGTAEVTALIHAGLVIADDRGQLRPRLADAVPSVENGLWKVLPDGTMETSWRIRPGAAWHDGTPFTTDDIVFTARVAQDKDLGVFHDIGFDSVESVEARDAQTVTVHWRKPYISADAMFAVSVMPKHLLEQPYTADRSNFVNLPYWGQDFVGAGPYRLRDWVRGSHLILEATPRYVLGKPRIDEIEVKTLPDANALAANVLAGTVDLTLGRNLSLEQGAQVRDQWPSGKMHLRLGQWLVMYPQVLTPGPPIVADARFRRALMHGIDRQEMADTLLQPGVSEVAHNFLAPKEPEYDDVQQYVVKYEFDPRRAAQIVEALGYTKGADGLYREPSGDLLVLEIRNRGIEIGTRAMFATADYWHRLGLSTESVAVPPQRGQDRQYMSTFPGFLLYNQSTDLPFLKRLHSSQTPLPANNFVGQNNSRYMSPEFDAMIDGVFSTIPRLERMQVLGTTVRHLTDNVLLMGLFYNALPVMIGSRLKNVPSDPYQAPWNAHEWDVE